MKNVCILFFLILFNVGNAQIINFPDPNFKNALVNTKCVDLDGNGTGDADADLNNDREIDVDEALKVVGLIVTFREISNLEGILNFNNLAFLNCWSNKLDTLHLEGLNNLTELDCSANLLTSLYVRGLNLKKLNCSINNLETLELQGLSSLLDFNCSHNKLKALEVRNVTNLEILYCSHNLLTSLNVSGMIKLKKIQCISNKLESLELRELPNLIYLSCYSNRLTILIVKGLPNLTELYCFGNIDLTSLDLKGMTNLRKLNLRNCLLFELDVEGLTNLIYLNCEDNILLRYLTIKGTNLKEDLYFNGNSDLRYICCDEGIISDVKSKTVSNGQNCEVNSYCSFTPGGKIYLMNGENTSDVNVNGCDDQDFKLPNFKFNIINGSDSGTFISNSTGNYSIPVQEGTHTITPILEYPEHFEVSPSSYTITFPNTSDTIAQDFCIIPKGIFRQINIAVIPLTPPARPGFEAKYKIVWENVGNQIESGTLNFTYDETLLDYISATQTADQIADGIVKWNFSNLLPFEKREITVTLKVNRPTDTPAVNAGDKLYFTASIMDNIFTLENTVVGSYDPNDKTCLQGDRVHPDMIGKYVDYLIRFENTGTYAAENVVVKDIIDTKRFDVSSLQITDASHEVYTRIEGNKVEFIFENIQLPFDDANNDGYIAFKIKTLSTLQLGDSLKNLADIYFDYNFPIRTNEAQTTVAYPVFTQDWVSDINVYPNPVSDILHLQTEETWLKAEIFDVSGRIIRAVSLSSQSIDVSTLESGTYFVRLRNGDRVGRVKFVKI